MNRTFRFRYGSPTAGPFASEKCKERKNSIMKNLNLKKFLSLLLTLTMCLSLATSAFAVEEPADDTDPAETIEPEGTEDEGIDEEMNTPSVYDEAIQAAGDAVGAAEEAVKNAQEAADAAANEAIEAVTDTTVEFIGQQTSVVDNANNVIDSAAEAAGNQAEIAANARETVESSTTSVAEKEAAVLIAQDAAQRAAEAAREAQNAWETANAAVNSAREAVAQAEAEYERILSEHSHDVDPEEFEAKLALAQEKLDAAKIDLDQKEAESSEASGKAEDAGKTAEEAEKTYTEAKNAAASISEDTIKNIAENEEAKKELDKKTQDAKDAQDALKNFNDSTSFDDLRGALNEASEKLNVAQNQKAAAEGNKADQAQEVQKLTGELDEAQDELNAKGAAIKKNTDDTTSYQGQLETYTNGLKSSQEKLAPEVKKQQSYKTTIEELETQKKNVTDTKDWNETKVTIGDGTNPIGIYALSTIQEARKDHDSSVYKEMVDRAKLLGYGDGFAQTYVNQKLTDALNKNPRPDEYIEDLMDADGTLKKIDGDLITQKNALENINTMIHNLEQTIAAFQSGVDEATGKLEELKAELDQLQKDHASAETKVEQLSSAKEEAEKTLKAFETLIEELEAKIGDLGNEKFQAEMNLSNAEEKENDLKNKLSAAISGLSEALYGKTTATSVEKLMDSKAKLEKAVEALNGRNAAVEAKEAADRAKEAADKAFQDASDAMEEAQAALDIAKDALDNASSDCTVRELAELRADLAARQAEFNRVSAEFNARQIARDQAEENARQAAQDAQNAQDALDSIIASLPTAPEDGDDGDTDGTDDADDATDDAETAPAELSIEDPLVPLAAGPVTRAQFVDFLWRHEGSPEADAPTFTDVPADHEFAPAIGWAQANSLVTGDENGAFQPDELVTVQAVRDILGNFAQAFSTNDVDAASLTTLTGEDGEAVLNCDEVLAEFFGEEYVPAVDEEDIAAA